MQIQKKYPIVNDNPVINNEQDAVIKQDQSAVDAENADATISAQELDILNNAGDAEEQDDINQGNAQVDTMDDEGELLNEKNDYAGGDLDVPGSDLDDADELIGAEDEENNSYSESDGND